METTSRPLILVSDDEPIVLKALARLAEKEGLSFMADCSSEQVFELAAAHRPQVIILDVRQNIDGRDLLARLKRDPRTEAIKVLMLSGIEDQFMRHNCFQLGAADYDVKPVDECFMAKVARVARAELSA